MCKVYVNLLEKFESYKSYFFKLIIIEIKRPFLFTLPTNNKFVERKKVRVTISLLKPFIIKPQIRFKCYEIMMPTHYNKGNKICSLLIEKSMSFSPTIFMPFALRP